MGQQGLHVFYRNLAVIREANTLEIFHRCQGRSCGKMSDNGRAALKANEYQLRVHVEDPCNIGLHQQFVALNHVKSSI